MKTICRFSLIVFLACVSSVAAFAGPKPSAVPLDHSAWYLLRLPQADLIILLELLENPRENAERLLASDDPEEVGLGIFVASYSGDLDRLLAARDLLFDERETIPLGNFVDSGDSARMSCSVTTIGRYLARTYRAWFGVSSAARAQEIHAIVTGIAERGDAWEHAATWHRRYVIEIPEETRADILEKVRAVPPDDMRRSYSAYSSFWARIRADTATPRVMEDILAIPDDTLRLFVAHEIASYGAGKSTTGNEDVQRILDSLTPRTRDAIRTRSLVYPPDGVYHEPPPNDYRREGVYKWYEEWTRRAE